MGSLMEDRMPLQRVRITFAKGDALRYISHLDLARTWERVLRRAGLPVAYSQGFNPRQRFQIAAALPVGVVGRAELLDVWLVEPLSPEEILDRLGPALPSGLEVSRVVEVELRSPSLQSQMRTATYRALVRSPEPVEAIQGRVQGLLQAPTLPRRRHHKGAMQTYDLRPLIRTIDVHPGQTWPLEGLGDQPPGSRGDRPPESHEDRGQVVTMCLQTSPQGAGRPDEVLDALGLSMVVDAMERTNLNFEFDK
jgi:radical SAM-linked protein